MKNLINKIEQNQKTIESYGKIDLAVLNKINYKLRLDWNYYSNRMEGGTLTRAETRSVMVQNINVKGKPFKDVAEMQGHDNVVLDVLKIVKGELRISEKRIKEIHKAIMFESDTEKAKQIGVWKTEANEIINYRSEKVDFAVPSEVAEEIHTLLNKTNAELDKYFTGKSKKHVIEIATEFHINFLTIHPFYDGNGRVARILTNLILISCSYPVIIIKEKEKKSYYNLLADIQCYGGNKDLLEDFFSERLIESQQLVIYAIEGKDIDEKDDLDKKLEMLKKEVEAIDKEEIKEKLSEEVFYEMVKDWIKPLFVELVKTTIKFNEFYTEPNHHINFKLNESISSVSFKENPDYSMLFIKSTKGNKNLKIENGKVAFSTFFGQFKKGGHYESGCNYRIDIFIEMYSYHIELQYFDNTAKDRLKKVYDKRLLHQGLSKEEIKEINKLWGESLILHLEHIMKTNK